MRQLLTLILLVILAVASFQVGSSALRVEADEWAVFSKTAKSSNFKRFVRTTGGVITAQSAANTFKDTVPADSAVVIADLNSPLTVGYGADKRLTAASLYKLYTANALYKRIDNGTLQLDDELEDAPGIDVEECMRLMIVISDNVCAIIFGEFIGWDVLQQEIVDEGFSATFVNNYNAEGDIDGRKYTTARDDGDLLSASSRALFLDLLSQQEINDRIPQTIPSDDIAFWHKTGNLESAAHDAGFIIGPSDQYLYVIMSDDWQVINDAYTKAPDIFVAFFDDILPTLFDY